MIYEQWLSEFTDWRPRFLYWQRFSIAEENGPKEIKASFQEIFEEAKTDFKRLTELVMVLNHKMFEHSYKPKKDMIYKMYMTLYNKAKTYAEKHLHGDALRYYLDVTD